MERKHLILLHGALGAKMQLEKLAHSLENRLEVTILEFAGHGNTPRSGSFGIELFAKQLKAHLEKKDIQKPLVFGYSMGGYVALKCAVRNPGIFEKLITLGTKFNWTPETAEQEVKQLNPDKIQEKVPEFAAYLKRLHGEENWRKVLVETGNMMLEMGSNPPLSPDDLKALSFPVVFLRGSGDRMVTEVETQPYVQAAKNGIYQEIADWKHPIDKIPVEELEKVLNRLIFENHEK